MGHDHPIIFSAPMVRAIIDGQKTETRRMLYSDRVMKDGKIPLQSPTFIHEFMPDFPVFGHYWMLTGWHSRKPGDRLWVREKIHVRPIASAMHAVSYFNEENPKILGGWEKVRLLPYYHKIKRPEKAKWLPSIHMPRDLSRLTLIVESVKIERLQDMDDATAMREGIECRGRRDFWAGGCRGTSALECFKAVWWSLHGIGSWNENPWVVAIRFRPILANIDAPEAKAA